MESINLWCKLIALISVVSAVTELIVPENKIKKTYRMLMTFILIFAFVSPLSDNIDSPFFSEDFESSYKIRGEEALLSEYTDYALIYAVQSETEKYIKETLILSELNIDCDVRCICENGVIKINSIEFSGEINDESKHSVFIKISGICDKDTKFIFNGEEYVGF